MIKTILTLFTILIISNYAFSQYTFEVEITGIRNNDGVIMLQLFDEAEVAIGQEKWAVMENKCAIIIKNLKPGKYAVRYFHDENLNGTLETNKISVPTERYGFSNNTYGMFWHNLFYFINYFFPFHQSFFTD